MLPCHPKTSFFVAFKMALEAGVWVSQGKEHGRVYIQNLILGELVGGELRLHGRWVG